MKLMIHVQTGELESVDSVTVAPGVQKLFEYIRDRGTLVPITTYNKCALPPCIAITHAGILRPDLCCLASPE